MKLIPTLRTILFLLRHFTKIKTFNREECFRFSLDIINNDGLFLEFGVFTGDSINKIADLILDKIIYGFDSFNGLPEDWCGHERGHLKVDNIQKVLNGLLDNVCIIVGLFQETLESFLEEHKEKVAFIHLDADIYSSTKYVLDTLAKYNRFQQGTVIQFDEFLSINFLSDEQSAFEDFVEENSIKYDVLVVNNGRVAIKIMGGREVE